MTTLKLRSRPEVSRIEGGLSRERLELGWDTSVEVEDKGDRLVAEMHLPGIDSKHLSVSVGDNFMRVTGSREEMKQDKEAGMSSNEFLRESFQRLVKFPDDIVPERSSAVLDHGDLKIMLPKRRHVPRRIGTAEYR